MIGLGVGIVTFACLTAAAIGAMLLSPKLPESYRSHEAETVVRLVSGIFALMTSLVFGLMINSAKNTYEATSANVHVYATSLIVLDRTMRHVGDEADAARQLLIRYVEEALVHPARANTAVGNPAAQALDRFGDALAGISVTDDSREDLLAEARQQYRDVVKARWTIVEQSEGAIPTALIAMLVAWLTVIFANFGYRAPANALTVGLLLVSSNLIAGSFYLVLDMTAPFSGPVRVSDEPLRRALIEMQAAS